MNRNSNLLAGLLVVMICVAGAMALKHRSARNHAAGVMATGAASTPLPQAQVSTPPPAELVSSAVARLNSDPAIVPAPASAPVQSRALAPTQKVAQVKKPSTKKVFQDPVARDALKYVGFDPDAEIYWFSAIQDSSLPTSERQDLIDDLNEEGLPDPKHPTIDDLPLILSRLRILEELVPSIADSLEWKESYEDLLNLAAVATGGGKPIH